MFTNYPIDPDYIGYEPRIYLSSYPRTRTFYQPAQSYYRPCSYYHNNASPFYYSRPQNYSYFNDEEDEREQLFRDLLNREMAYRQQEEREREQQEQLKRFYERKAREQAQRPGSPPKKSFKVKIQGGEDEAKSAIKKSQAARKISNFIRNQTANKQTLKILDKFYSLRKIENELKEIRNSKIFGNLTFVEEHEKQVLPISVENKRFLEYENKILKLFDKLDRIQSEGVDIVRERRKFLVKSAQALLEELDNEKENQWMAFRENQSNSEVVINGAENSELNSDMIINDVENLDISSSSDVIPENEGSEVKVGGEQLGIEESIPTSSQSNIEMSNQNESIQGGI